MHVPIKGKTVVITGASRGIGKATAQLLAQKGARLALIARAKGPLDALAQSLKQMGADVRTYALDLRDEAAVQAMAESVKGSLGGADALVNNAAVGTYGSFMKLTLDNWREMLDINVLGLVSATRALLPHMLEKEAGHVLNIASVQGTRTSPSSSAYSATKFALMGITDSLAQEMQPKGIRVSVLCPGGVATDFAGTPAESKEDDALTPDDVAIAIVQMLETGGKALLTRSLLLPFTRE